MFKRNEGILDRIVRISLGAAFLPAGLFLFGGLQGNVPGVVVAGVGSLALITGLSGVCLLYIPFGISTLQIEKDLIARCRSMMTGSWRGDPDAGQACGPCSPSAGKTRHQQGEPARPQAQ